MSRRALLHQDVLLAALGIAAGPGEPGPLGAAARDVLRELAEDGVELLVASTAWPVLLDRLRARGATAAGIAEAVHALDGLDLVTVDVGDRATVLLVGAAMERHGLAAADAAAVALGEILEAPVVTLDPTIAAAAPTGHLVGSAAPASAVGRASPARGPGPADYHGLGALLGELRRRAVAG